jgi:hypothetical protein
VRYVDENGDKRAFETHFENTLQNCGHPQRSFPLLNNSKILESNNGNHNKKVWG